MTHANHHAKGIAPRRLAPSRLATPLAMVVALTASAGCGGQLGERSYGEASGEVPIAAGIERVRLEIENGTLGIDRSDGAVLTWSGGVRRAADTPAELALLEQVPLQLSAAPDPADPRTLVVRGPRRPEATPGAVMALELGIRVPAELVLRVEVAANGHITVANRRAATEVETGRGDLRFENCSGGVVARTGRGMVIAFGHRGDLDVNTKSGDMQAFVEEPAASIRLVTGQGTIQCQVAPSIEFDLDARAEIGKIGNGFGLTPEVVRDYGAVLIGKRGSARTKVVLRTGSGHLSIAPLRSG